MIQTMQDHIDKEEVATKAGTATATPDTLLNRIVDRITIECQRLESEAASKRGARPGSEYSNIANSGPRPIAKHANNPLGVICTNCNGRSHDHEHCFAQGGGMAGQGPKGAAKTAKAQSTSKGKESALVAADVDALEDGEILCATIEDMDAKEVSESVILAAIAGSATVLDSGATSHLIQAWEYFWSYDPEKACQVTTANLGTLRTEASGDCHAYVSAGGRQTRIKLKDCLHSPQAVLNLVSVGRLIDAQISCTFAANGVQLSRNGSVFASGNMVNRLFVIDIEFIPAPIRDITFPRKLVPPTDTIMLFAKVAETLELWHLRLGHPSEAAMKALVRSAQGINLGRSHNVPYRCEPCILSKHAALPHPIALCAQPPTTLLELVHCDICGPFPVQTPHGKLYFIVFLDDASSVNNVQLLATRDQALEALQLVKAKWELKVGKKILRFHCDGAGEFKGDFAAFLLEHGIELDVTPMYEHWMNGKAERFMRTIQSRMLAMMTSAQLPMTYWGEAALTASYLSSTSRRRGPSQMVGLLLKSFTVASRTSNIYVSLVFGALCMCPRNDKPSWALNQRNAYSWAILPVAVVIGCAL
jgi:hypothetical protein